MDRWLSAAIAGQRERKEESNLGKPNAKKKIPD
jgi:hypothetical protein